MKELEGIINSFRDPQKVEAEKREAFLREEMRKRDFQATVMPIVRMGFADPLLAEEMGKNVTKENRRSQKALGENSKEQEKMQALENRAKALEAKTKALEAAKEDEEESFGY